MPTGLRQVSAITEKLVQDECTEQRIPKQLGDSSTKMPAQVNLPKVFLTGGDHVGWALDDDLSLTRTALKDVVEFTDFKNCDVVHSVDYESLANLPSELLRQKRVICQVNNRPYHYFTRPLFAQACTWVDLWVAQTREAERELASVRIPSYYVPYAVDMETFHPLGVGNEQVHSFMKAWNIPSDKYLVGNFHRDTEGRDPVTPKAQKGPEIFARIVFAIKRQGYPIHVILAGPRRFWIRRTLAALDVPFTYIGQLVEGDDYPRNNLSRHQLNLIYNLLDLYIVSSRWEGGPRSILEATASKCKIISSRVGVAEDILNPDCIYGTALRAIELVEKDIATDNLQAFVESNYENVKGNHTVKSVGPYFAEVYKNLGKYLVARRAPVRIFSATQPKKESVPWRFAHKLKLVPKEPPRTVGLWHQFYKPPYGGGNQFMLALKKALKRKGVLIKENTISPLIDVYLLNSVHFDIDRFQKYRRQHKLRVVHRIDGPIQLYRGHSAELDQLCFELNATFAAATIIQSTWTYQRILELGYTPVNPVIIRNAVDPEIFHKKGRITFDPQRKIRLISTSWSNNPRKGGSIYKWVEDHLDWNRFEYTFVGNASERFDHIKHILAVGSEKLAQILRQHDIYITASQNDPCSNALLEALACGLPALYLNSGGHPELVGYGGLPFNDVDEIFPQLERLIENIEMFQNLIVVPSLDDVAGTYWELLRGVI